MEVKFDITKEDYLKCNKIALYKSPMLKRKFILSIMLVAILFLLLIVIMDLGFFIGAIFYILMMCIFLGLFYLSRNMQAKSIMKNDKTGFIGGHSVKIDDSGIHSERKLCNGSYKWDSIYAIEQSEEYIIIFVSYISAFFIPKRAFETKDKENEFYNKAVEYWNAARHVNV